MKCSSSSSNNNNNNNNSYAAEKADGSVVFAGVEFGSSGGGTASPVRSSLGCAFRLPRSRCIITSITLHHLMLPAHMCSAVAARRRC
jgi:hypothetical protein